VSYNRKWATAPAATFLAVSPDSPWIRQSIVARSTAEKVLTSRGVAGDEALEMGTFLMNIVLAGPRGKTMPACLALSVCRTPLEV
jgi:hypothetical protein